MGTIDPIQQGFTKLCPRIVTPFPTADKSTPTDFHIQFSFCLVTLEGLRRKTVHLEFFSFNAVVSRMGGIEVKYLLSTLHPE